jgi:hypothetical protein
MGMNHLGLDWIGVEVQGWEGKEGKERTIFGIWMSIKITSNFRRFTAEIAWRPSYALTIL